MKRQHVILSVAILLAVAFTVWFVFFCNGPKPPSSRVKVGYVSSGLTGLAVEIMKEQKMAEKHGLQPEFVGFANPQALNQAFFLGELDVNMAAGANVVASQAGTPEKFVYFHPTLLNTVSVIVRNDDPYQQLSDLKGKKVAWYGPLSGGGTGFMALCERTGIGDTKAAFQLIQTTPGTEGVLLERKEVDAAIAFEPIGGKLIASGRYRSVFGSFSKEWKKLTGGDMEMAGMAASEAWYRSHPREARQIVAAWVDTVDYISSNFAEITRTKTKLTGLSSPEELKYAQSLSVYFARDWAQLEASITEQLKVLHQYQLLKSDAKNFLRKLAPE